MHQIIELRVSYSILLPPLTLYFLGIYLFKIINQSAPRTFIRQIYLDLLR